jgi:hypothetical protein
MEDNNNIPRTGSGQEPESPGQDGLDLTENIQNNNNKVWTAYKNIAQRYHKVLKMLAMDSTESNEDKPDHPIT